MEMRETQYPETMFLCPPSQAKGGWEKEERMRTYLTYGVLVLFGMVLLCWIINMILAKRKNENSVWLGRGVYMFGMLAVVLNAVRVWMLYDDSKGIMIAAHVVVLLSVVVSFFRMERENKNGPELPEEGQEL